MRSEGPTPADDSEDKRSEPQGTSAPTRRADESMTLITSMLERPLDPGYAAAAQQRREQGLPASTGTRRPLLIVWLLIIGVLIGMSTASLRSHDGARAGARADLIAQIETRQKAVDEQGTSVRGLRVEIDAATARLDPDLVGTREEELESMRISSGLVPVRGEGLRITLDDAPGSETSADGDPRTGTSDEGRVRSKDLQIITNGLWSSGAEALAVNGQRLTSRTAIRFAGEAILVNFRPLTRPYTIEAVGSSDDLQTGFAESAAGSYLTGLRTNYAIKTSLTTQDDLHLPGATSVSTRQAEVIPSGSTPPAVTPRTKETS